jgi:archaellum biogenesis ATPase FlaH
MDENSGEELVLDTEQIKRMFSLTNFQDFLKYLSQSRFKSGKSIMLYGPPGEGREVVLYDYTRLVLEAGYKIIWVTTHLPPLKLKEILSDFHRYDSFWDEHASQIHIVDMCGTVLRNLDEDLTNVTYMEKDNLADLLNTLIQVDQGMQANVIIVDTLSGFLRFSNENSVIHFLGNMINYSSKKKSTTVVTLNEGEEDPKLDVSICSICDFIFHTVDMEVNVKITNYPLSGRRWDIK